MHAPDKVRDVCPVFSRSAALWEKAGSLFCGLCFPPEVAQDHFYFHSKSCRANSTFEGGTSQPAKCGQVVDLQCFAWARPACSFRPDTRERKTTGGLRQEQNIRACGVSGRMMMVSAFVGPGALRTLAQIDEKVGAPVSKLVRFLGLIWRGVLSSSNAR